MFGMLWVRRGSEQTGDADEMNRAAGVLTVSGWDSDGTGGALLEPAALPHPSLPSCCFGH